MQASTGAKRPEAQLNAQPRAPPPLAAQASTGAKRPQAPVDTQPIAPPPLGAQASAKAKAKTPQARVLTESRLTMPETKTRVPIGVDDAFVVESLLRLRDSACAPPLPQGVSKKQRVAPAPLSKPAVAEGQGGRAAGPAGGVAGAGPEAVDPHDVHAVDKAIGDGEKTGEINPNAARRLKALARSLREWEAQGLLLMQTPGDEPGGASSPSEACILGWSRLLVKQPHTLNLLVSEMVEADKGGIWKKANGKYGQELKNPTWSVYELFRMIGVKPHMRAAAVGDPGKKDMFYYKEWEFRNDGSFKTARERLAKGYSFCPDKGGRKRKRERTHAPGVQPGV